MRKVRLVVTIDVECDKRPDWSVRRPLTFRSVKEGLVERLLPLCREYGIRPTLLLSPEVLMDERSVEDLSRVGDWELGTHAHVEFLDPASNWEAVRTDGTLAALPPEIEWAKLVRLTELFRSRFGGNPTSFRAGRFALSRKTLRFLAELGYRVDSSVTPFRSWTFGNGVRVNHWGAPPWPYRPSDRDWRRTGTLPIWEVPVTIAARPFLAWPGVALRQLDDASFWRRRVVRYLGGDVEAVWLRPLRTSAERLLKLADLIVAAAPRTGPAVLNVMFHSVELVPGASPYAQTESDVLNLLESLAQLTRHVVSHHAGKSTTLRGLLAELEPTQADRQSS